MKVSREQAAESREKILVTAARLFRERGFDGIGISDLMRRVGLTHGGFYGHFSSKEDLIVQSCERAVDDLIAQEYSGNSKRNYYQRFVERYLSVDHRDNPGSGCLIATLGADAARQSADVKRAFTKSVNRLLGALMNLLPAAKSDEVKREEALLTLATLVGAQVIARAVDDPELSEEILRVVSKNLH